MPAHIECQPDPDGTPRFVFCTEKVGGHGDLIGGVEELDRLYQELTILVIKHKTPVGQRVQSMMENDLTLRQVVKPQLATISSTPTRQ